MGLNNDGKDDGGYVFPSAGKFGESAARGMILRDWFAGQALMGMVAMKPYEHTPSTKQEAAKECYELADAMLAARERKEEEI